MKQIERYIFRRVLILSAATLATTTVIAMTTQVLLRVDLLSSTGQSLLAFLELAGLLILPMMQIVMPFALMIGAAQTLSTMNSDSELAVIEASGGAGDLIARPILVIAIGMSIFCLVESTIIEPWSNRQIRLLLDKASADLFSAAVQSGTFHEVDENLYVSVAQKYPGGRLGGIFLSDSRNEDFRILYFSKYGDFSTVDDSDVLVMTDGEIHRQANDSGDLSIIRFDNYTLDLRLIGGRSGKRGRYQARERSTAFLLNPDPKDKQYQKHPDHYQRELNRRFSEWLYPLLFGVITVYFLGRAHSNRNEQVWSVMAAVSIAFAIRGFGFYATGQSATNTVLGVLCYGVPITSIVIFGVLSATGWTFRAPKSLVEALDTLLSGNDPLKATLRNWLVGVGGTGRKGAQ